MSIKNKFFLTFFIVLSLISFTSVLFFSTFHRNETIRLIKNKGEVLADAVSYATMLGLEFRSIPSVMEATKGVRAVKEYRFVGVFDQENQLFAQDKFEGKDKEEALKLLAQGDKKGQFVEASMQSDLLVVKKVLMSDSGEKVGTLFLGFDLKEINQAIKSYQIVIGIISIVLLVIGSLIGYIFARRVSISMLRFLQIAEGLGSRAGDLTQRVPIHSNDEIGRLAEVFNKIIESMHDMVSRIRSTAERVATSSQEMSSTSEEVNATAQEVASAVAQVTKGTNTQASRIEETYKIIEIAASSLREVVAKAYSTNKAVNNTSLSSEKGRAAAQEAVAKIEELTKKVLETTQIIQELGKMSQEINEITETINSIADQTNLLALNAAIEAARAGEAGRGFAVVADEVRKLAVASAEAVSKIGRLINSIQNGSTRAVEAIQVSSREVKEGEAQVVNISEALVEINTAATEAAEFANQIAVSGQQQVDEMARVVKAINEISSVAKDSASTAEGVAASTEEQTASMQELSASAQELANLAMDLKNLVGKFKLREITDKSA